MSKEPLTKKEQEILILVAGEYGDFRYAPGGLPVPALEAVLFFLDTGAHPSILANPGANLRTVREGDKIYLEWNRPKKKGIEAFTRIRASKRIAPFIEAFITRPKPSFRQFYNRLLTDLAHHIEKTRGDQGRGLSVKNLTPLALRHTFGINRLEDGMSPEMVQQLMNCSEKTLKYYSKYRREIIEQKLDEIDW